MVKIEFPSYPFKIKEEHGRELIFDEVRKRWVKLTREEWVRQNFIQYLIQIKHYPGKLISIEKEIWLHDVKRRYDIVVYKQSYPWMIVECKEMNIPLQGEVLQQLLHYHLIVPCSYLVITNGSQTYAWTKSDSGLIILNRLPDW